MQGWQSSGCRAGLIAITASLVSSCLLTSSFDGLTGAPGAPDAGPDTSMGGAGSSGSAASSSSGGGVGGAFPSTSLLDDFTRADGAPGAPWLVETKDAYSINSRQLSCMTGDPGVILWGDAFGPDQEVFVTIQALDPGDAQLELILKSQPGVVQECESLQVDYQYPNLKLHKCTGGMFEDIGAGTALSLMPGDQLGARVYANGTVEAYKNGVLVKSWDASSWPQYKNGGRIGWASYGIVKPAIIDNFGGGG
jgi:hypothetical protein